MEVSRQIEFSFQGMPQELKAKVMGHLIKPNLFPDFSLAVPLANTGREMNKLFINYKLNAVQNSLKPKSVNDLYQPNSALEESIAKVNSSTSRKYLKTCPDIISNGYALTWEDQALIKKNTERQDFAPRKSIAAEKIGIESENSQTYFIKSEKTSFHTNYYTHQENTNLLTIKQFGSPKKMIALPQHEGSIGRGVAYYHNKQIFITQTLDNKILNLYHLQFQKHFSFDLEPIVNYKISSEGICFNYQDSTSKIYNFKKMDFPLTLAMESNAKLLGFFNQSVIIHEQNAYKDGSDPTAQTENPPLTNENKQALKYTHTIKQIHLETRIGKTYAVNSEATDNIEVYPLEKSIVLVQNFYAYREVVVTTLVDMKVLKNYIFTRLVQAGDPPDLDPVNTPADPSKPFLIWIGRKNIAIVQKMEQPEYGYHFETTVKSLDITQEQPPKKK